VALRLSGDKTVLYRCRVLGTQDTLFDNIGRHYFYSCHIQGSIDFISGDARSLYQVGSEEHSNRHVQISYSITVLEFKLRTLCPPPVLHLHRLVVYFYAHIISLPSDQSCSVAITRNHNSGTHQPCHHVSYSKKSLTFLLRMCLPCNARLVSSSTSLTQVLVTGR
jgi:hypothetical protein